MGGRLRLPSGGTALLLVDLLVALWVILWIVLGVTVADAVRGLTELSSNVETAGRAVDDSGRALGSLDLPLIGGALEATARQIQEAGASVVAGGASSRATIERLSIVLGLTVAVVPLVPVLLSYAPPRVERALEVRSVKRLLAAGAGDPLLERFLAERATHHLSYRALGRVSAAPWRDIEEGRYTNLAGAELRRVGLSHGALTPVERER
jgi:hypothetical protein